MLQHESVVAELQRQRGERGGRAAQRLQRRDLRSDVDVHADKLQVLHVAAGAINPARLLQRHAELVRLEAGGDVRVALRIDVRIDAHGDARRRSLRTRDRCDTIELAGRFGVDGADALRDRVLELVACLADAREDDVTRREAGALDRKSTRLNSSHRT